MNDVGDESNALTDIQVASLLGLLLESDVPAEIEQLADSPSTELLESLRSKLGPDDGKGHLAGGDAYPGFGVTGKIGRGGFATVYLAREYGARRNVALKTPTSREGRRDLERQERFLNEAYITAQLQHPGISPVYRIDDDKLGRPYYTMRPIEGVTLREILEKLTHEDKETLAQFPLRRLVRILHNCCQTIRFAHDQGVVHRDLKPAHIVVGDYGEALVIDWGLAKVIGPAESVAGAEEGRRSRYQRQVEGLRQDEDTRLEATKDGSVVGTPAYMSPEQAAGDVAEVDFQSDVWALGVILYELCTLKRPFKAQSVRKLVQQITTAEPADPISANPRRRVLPELAEIALRCLEKDKSKRYASVADLAQDLENWLEGIAPWRVMVDVDFSKLPDGEPEGWTALGGDWHVQAGCLAPSPEGPEERVALLNAVTSGDVRVEMEAMVVRGAVGEVSAMLSAPTPGMGKSRFFDDGYCVQFGAEYGICAKIAKNTDDVARAEIRCERGRWYRVVAERVGETIRLVVDDEEILRWRDYVPLNGQHVGIYNWGTGLRVRKFRVLSPGVSVTVSCLQVPNAFYNEGMIAEARREYLRVAESHPDRTEGSEALFLAGRCCLDLAGGEDARADEANALLDEAWRYFDRLEQSHMAPLGCLGKSFVNEFQGNFGQEAEELARAYRDYSGYDGLDIVGGRLWERVIHLADLAEGPLFAGHAYRYHPKGAVSPEAMRRLADLPDPAVGERIFADMVGYLRPGAPLGRAQLNLAVCLTRNGRTPEAIAVLEQALADPDTPESERHLMKVMLASLLVLCGRGCEALALMQKYWRESRANGRQGDPSVLCALGVTYLRMGRPERAEALHRQVLACFPSHDETCAEALRALALVCAQQGRADEALAICERVLTDYPSQLPARGSAAMTRGSLMAIQARYEEAIAQLETNLAEKTGSRAIWVGTLVAIGVTYALQGRRQDVLTTLERGLTRYVPWAFRAALDESDHEVAEQTGRDVEMQHIYHTLLALGAYARGDDRAAMEYLEDLPELEFLAKKLLAVLRQKAQS